MAEVKFEAFAGINNQAAPERLTPSDLAAAINVDVDDAQRLVSRTGYALRHAGNVHSLQACAGMLYFRADGNLCRMDVESGVTSVADSGLSGETAYVALSDRLYYSDGSTARRLVDGEAARNWGITPPLALPALSEVHGALPPGRYLVTLAFLRDDMAQSGAPTPAAIDVTQGGIRMDGLPTSTEPGVTFKAIYISMAGGEALHLAMVIDNAQTSASYEGDGSDFGYLLDTLHKTPPPPSLVMAVWNGRVLLGASNFILYSDAYWPELFDPLRQSIPLDSAVTLFAPLTPDACVVATEGAIYRLEGGDINAVRIVQLADFGAIRGTLATADGATLSDSGTLGRVAVFASQRGICVVGGTGEVSCPGLKRYALAGGFTAGASVVRERAGLKQAIFSLR